jgi:hypothetical protein
VPEEVVGLMRYGPTTGWHKYLIIRTINPEGIYRCAGENFSRIFFSGSSRADSVLFFVDSADK